MSTKSYKYRVTITFDLSYAKNPHYKVINTYLDGKEIYSLKSSDEHMPSNIYTGVVEVDIDVSSAGLTLANIKSGAEKAVRNTFEGIKRAANKEMIDITLYVQASLEDATSSRKSKE